MCNLAELAIFKLAVNIFGRIKWKTIQTIISLIYHATTYFTCKQSQRIYIYDGIQRIVVRILIPLSALSGLTDEPATLRCIISEQILMQARFIVKIRPR
ncbi:hypothetical protein LFZ32_11775 [Salmonella enterica subsp. enterica serovar Newport str. L0167]|nr:hypothetical protein LFZ32_11775 [Salmonella enterica subsp. enterica serovar Newport str. L0167]